MDVNVHIPFENVISAFGILTNPALGNGGFFAVMLLSCLAGGALCRIFMHHKRTAQISECAQFLPGIIVQFEKVNAEWMMTVVSKGPERLISGLEALPEVGRRTPLNWIFDEPEAKILADVLENAHRLNLPVNHECQLKMGSAEASWVSIRAFGGDSGKKPVLNGVVINIMDRRVSEREIFEEKEFNEQLLEYSGVLFSVSDRNGKLIRANKAYFDIGGYTSEEIYFSDAERNLLGDSYDGVMRIFKDVLEGKYPIVNENSWNCKDGSTRMIRWTNTGLRNAEGELAYVISVGTDITDLRVLEAQLQHKIDEISALFENSLVGMALIVKGRIVKANQVCAEMLGYTTDEIDNLSFERLFSDEASFNAFANDVFPRIKKGLRHFDYAFRKKDGKHGEFRISASPLSEAPDKDQIIVVLDDVSEIKMVERALRRSETRFRTIVDKMASGLALINEEGYFEEVNDSWCRITGYSREEALHLSVLDITQNGDLGVSRDTMKALLADTAEMKRMEKRYIRKDGTMIWVDLTASKIDERATHGKTTLLSIINDITERKAIDEELKSMNCRLEAERINVQRLADQRMAVFGLFDTFRESKSIEDLMGILKNNLPHFVKYRDLMTAIRISRGNPGYVVRDMLNETQEADILQLITEGKGIIGTVIQNRQMYLSNDVRQDAHFVSHNPNVRSYMAFPIIYKDFLWGVIGLDHFEAGHFTEEDAEILSMVGTLIAMQMEEMTTKLELHLESDRLKTLHDMVQEMAKARANEDILWQICSGKLFQTAHVYTASPKGRFNPCICLECRNQGRFVPTEVIDAEGGKPFFWKEEAATAPYNMGIEIRYNEKPLGILRVTSSLEFSDSDIELGSILAEQTGAFLELNDLIAQREREAMIDPLTGVWNRRYMFERLEQEDERLLRYGGKACVAILDMGDFKLINDTYGHVKGDQVLAAAARAIEDSIRRTDFVGRYGGDEFIVFLPNTELAEAEKIVEKIRKSITMLSIDEIRHVVDIDGGVAIVPGDDSSLIGAIRAADEKMYFNKRERKRQSLLRN